MVIGRLGVERQPRDDRDGVGESLAGQEHGGTIAAARPAHQARETTIDVRIREFHTHSLRGYDRYDRSKEPAFPTNCSLVDGNRQNVPRTRRTCRTCRTSYLS